MFPLLLLTNFLSIISIFYLLWTIIINLLWTIIINLL